MKKTQDLNLFGEALVVKYWPMALVFLLVFIPVSFFHNNDQLSGWLQTFDLAILIAIYFYFKKTRKPAPLGHALTFLGIPILVGWLINGGPDNMGLWWTLVYTVWVFLLNSTKWAFRWSLIFVSVMVLTYLLSKPFHYPIAYTTTTLLNLSFAYVFTTLLLLFFHLATTHYFGLFESELEERKEAEEKLEKLAMIINASSDAIFSKGKNNLILTWNPGAEKIFGYKAEEIIGQSGLVLIPKHLEDEESTIISKVLNGAQLEHFETFRLKKDGTRMAVSLNYSPILEKNGDVDSISTSPFFSKIGE